MPRPFLVLLHASLSLVASSGCNSLVKVDVDCKRLCMEVPGPTIPALSNQLPPAVTNALASWDGGIAGILAGVLDGGIPDGLPALPTADWVAELAFNKVLAQLPSAAAGLSADVRLTSIALSSTTDLDFVDSIEVTISHAGASSSSGKSSGSTNAGSNVNCRAKGFAMRVAYFQRVEGAANGPTINLTMVAPDMNLFDCLRDSPTRFEVKLAPRLGVLATADAPLTLGTCIGAATHLSYP